MVINKQGMSVPEEKTETTKLLDCLKDVKHSESHRDAGAGDHRHYHSPRDTEAHHDNLRKHHDYDPDKSPSTIEHSHSHTHEGDSFAVLDVELNEIAIAENEFADVNGIDLIQA